MAMKGMDVELVTEFGNRMKGEMCERVRDLRTTLTQLGHGLNWEGHDAEEFVANRLSGLTQALDRLVEQLDEFGLCAVNNANAQAEVSARL